MDQRAGKTRFDTSGFPAGKRAEHMRNWYVGSTKLLLASIDGDLYSFTASGAGTLIYNGTAGTVWDIETSQDSTGADRAWFMNGVDPAQKWDGITGTTVAWTNTPPNGTVIRVWKNRMVISGVAANKQRLFFSDIGNPEAPAATYGANWVDIKSTEDDLDPMSWIEVYNDYLIAFKKRSAWAVTDSNTFANRRLGAPGCEDRFQSSVAGGRCYFLAREGLYSSDGLRPPRYESDAVEPLIRGMNYQYIDRARVFPSRDEQLFVAIPYGGDTTNSRLLEYALNIGKDEKTKRVPWLVHDLAVSSACMFRALYEDELIAGAASTDRIHRLFEGLSDDGVAIAAYWLTGWKSLISDEPYERIRRINWVHTGRVYVEWFGDFNPNDPKFSAVKEAPVDADPYWDGGQWGGGQWDPDNATVISRVRPEKRAQYHAVKFSNNVLNKSFNIFAAELALRGGKEH